MPAPIIPDPRGLFENLHREHPFEAVEVDGEVPEALRGTLYRAGAGEVEAFGERVAHLFEADGALTALRFGPNGVEASARVVESAGLKAERAAGRRLPGPKNTGNTHVVPWQGGLYALMEAGLPTAIDPETLATLGEVDLGVIQGGMFSAHPHRVNARRSLYNFGMSYGPRTTVDLFALPDVGAARLLGRLPVERPVMLHDFIATERHLVLFISPLHLVIEKIMQRAPFAERFAWNPEAGTEVIVVPLDAPEAPTRFKTDAFFQFHFAAAFEERSEIVVDYVRYDDAGLLGALGDGRGLSFHDPSRHVGGALHRARIDPAARTFRSEPRWDGFCEFPRIADRAMGGRHEHVWVQSEGWRDGVLRFSVTRIDARGEATHHHLPPGHHASEPVLAQAPGCGETDGSALVLVYDSVADRSYALVLDAHTLEPQARVALTQPIPVRFHGSWVAA